MASHDHHTFIEGGGGTSSNGLGLEILEGKR